VEKKRKRKTMCVRFLVWTGPRKEKKKGKKASSIVLAVGTSGQEQRKKGGKGKESPLALLLTLGGKGENAFWSPACRRWVGGKREEGPQAGSRFSVDYEEIPS